MLDHVYLRFSAHVQRALEFTEHSHSEALCEGDEFIMDVLRIRGALPTTCNG
jgi:hypothetical protein